MEEQIYKFAKQMEDAVDDELHKMNNMDEDDLENIRRKRLEAMKGDQHKRKEYLAKVRRRRLRGGRCKLFDPAPESSPVSKFDTEKDNSAFNLNLGYF